MAYRRTLSKEYKRSAISILSRTSSSPCAFTASRPSSFPDCNPAAWRTSPSISWSAFVSTASTDPRENLGLRRFRQTRFFELPNREPGRFARSLAVWHRHFISFWPYLLCYFLCPTPGGCLEIRQNCFLDRRYLGLPHHRPAVLHVRSHRQEGSSAHHSSRLLLRLCRRRAGLAVRFHDRSEEHTSELQ